MSDTLINGKIDQLKYLFGFCSEFSENLEMQSHFAKYLCVLMSGLLENSVRHYFSKFSSKKSHPFSCNYINASLSEFRNPKMEKILILAGSFSPKWRDEIEEFVDGERKDAIDSIVDLRHNIVHGREVGSLTIIRMKTYFEKALEVIKFIEAITIAK